MNLLVDSSALIELERGTAGPELSAALRGNAGGVSVVTVSELLRGVHRASAEHRARRRSVVDRILTFFDAVPIDFRIATVHSELWAELDSRGNMIDSHDLWIAATAIAHDVEVLTLNNRDFERVPGLRLALV